MQNNRVEMRKKDKSHKIKTKTIYMRFLQSACVACRPFTKQNRVFYFLRWQAFPGWEWERSSTETKHEYWDLFATEESARDQVTFFAICCGYFTVFLSVLVWGNFSKYRANCKKNSQLIEAEHLAFHKAQQRCWTLDNLETNPTV